MPPSTPNKYCALYVARMIFASARSLERANPAQLCIVENGVYVLVRGVIAIVVDVGLDRLVTARNT